MYNERNSGIETYKQTSISMKSIITTVWARRVVVGLIVSAFIYGGYSWWNSGTESATITSAMVLHEVGKGTVTTGISTTGTIRSAEVLDLNVYKQNARIVSLAVVNGMRVEEGQLLFSFDESDVSVSIAESQTAVREAQIALAQKQEEVTDPNTTITTLRNDIAVLERNLEEYDADIRTALRDFLNDDLEAKPSADRYSVQVTRTAPEIGGLYSHTEEGIYTIYVYTSGTKSGFSYRVEGLESGTYEVFPGATVPLGSRGLTITFPAGSVQGRDEWVVVIPNTSAPEYVQQKEDYEKEVARLREARRTDMVTLGNKRTQLLQAERTDTQTQRDLAVESASLAIQKATVNLGKGIDTRGERRIVAPFSGTIEGVANVVVGATPSKESTDTTDFGKLISNDFIVSLALGATDVDRITLGDLVLVTLTSVPDANPLRAEVTEISSLPNTDAVAQYAISAKINNPDATSTVRLRDGMLADIEIVREEKQDVVRVPVSAVTFKEGNAQVMVVEGLSPEQERQFSRIGIIRTENSTHTSYPRTVSIGLRGRYFVEITDGLSVGERIVVSTTNTNATESTAVVRTGFGSEGARGGGRPPSM